MQIGEKIYSLSQIILVFSMTSETTANSAYSGEQEKYQ